MTIKKSSDLLTYISTVLADNNAGLISAEDVRASIYDTAESINSIVGSGNHDTAFPFTEYNVRAKKLFVTESGVQFPAGTQYVHYPGPQGISHNDFANLTAGDPHTQYYNVSGSRPLTGNMPTDTFWINSSGATNRGINFTYTSDREEVHIGGASGQIVFDSDSSKLDSAQQVAKAWMTFDGSGLNTAATPVVKASYGISGVQRVSQGKYKITFNSGVFKNNNYVPIGNSTSMAASGGPEDFDVNTVGMVMREGDDASALRTLTYYVRNDDNSYVDAEINDLVVFGLGPGVSSATPPTVS